MSAGASLAKSALVALAGVESLSGRYDGPPLTAAFPHAIVETGAESDWSHKSGVGREIRLAVTIRDKGERPDRLRRLMAASEMAVMAIGGEADGWRIASLVFLRSRTMRETGLGWAGVSEFRARMLAD
ncbi:MAG: tail completion protein gp17 [Sphingosinicella sp.]|uniref:tail completion protein gp17 n=1 Tax=Sphingosinicella sp. TaxID=1917971 RepID=UPI004037F07F